jgi:Trypsin-co-occurring domain 2
MIQEWMTKLEPEPPPRKRLEAAVGSVAETVLGMRQFDEAWRAESLHQSAREEPPMVEEVDGIGLADALESLRSELASAHTKAAGTDIQFPIETLTVELKVGVTRSAEGKAGFRVPFVGAELGGSAGYDRETLQTVTLVMGTPVDREGRPVKVAQASEERKD